MDVTGGSMLLLLSGKAGSRVAANALIEGPRLNSRTKFTALIE
jgi:hypothetical protein